MWRCYICLPLLYLWAVTCTFKCSVSVQVLLKIQKSVSHVSGPVHMDLDTRAFARRCPKSSRAGSRGHRTLTDRCEGERSQALKLSAHLRFFFRSCLSNIWPRKASSSVIYIERFFVRLLSPRTLGPVICTQTKAGTNHKVCIFVENASVCVRVSLCQ